MLRQKLKVKIDGKPNELTLVRVPNVWKDSNDYQYNTIGNTSAHRFQLPLDVCTKFFTSGTMYEIFDAL